MSTLSPTAKAAVERLAYSVTEAAAALGTSRSWVNAQITAGTIPSVRIGGRRLISATTLAALVAGEEDV